MSAGRTGWKGLGPGPGLGALTAGSQHSPSQRSAGDGIPGILLAPHTHQATVDGGEQAPPHCEATCKGTEVQLVFRGNPKNPRLRDWGLPRLNALAKKGETNPDAKR